MLGTVLGNLQGKVAGIDHILADAGDFIAEDERVLAPGLAAESAQLDRMDRLLHGDDGIPLRMQRGDGVQGVIEMLPRD